MEKQSASLQKIHLGISHNEVNNYQNTVIDRIKSARRALYSLICASLHGLNGAGPEDAILQYDTYVFPTFMYGLEAVC